jgi:hypothetical protein
MNNIHNNDNGNDNGNGDGDVAPNFVSDYPTPL